MLVRRKSRPRPNLGYRWVRVLPLLGAVGTLTVMHTPEVRPTPLDWLVALGSGLALFAGGRFPTTVLVAQCGLLLASCWSAPMGGTVAQILGSVALGELALRRPGAPTWFGVVALAAVGVVHSFPMYSAFANALVIAINVCVPLLFGSFVRAQRDLARQAELRAAEAELRRCSEVATARITERGVIARELHDVVAHHVAAIVLRAGVARHVVPHGDPELLEALSDVHSIGGEALADLRKLVALLRDPGPAEDPALLAAADLSTTLRGVVERTRQAGVRVSTELDADVLDRLDTVHRHAVWRVVQEGLTNVLKHAGPEASAQVRVGRDGEGAVVVEVRDDGVVPAGGARSDGHGLVVMRERVELLDGSLWAGPGERGWTLRAVLPNALRPAPARGVA